MDRPLPTSPPHIPSIPLIYYPVVWDTSHQLIAIHHTPIHISRKALQNHCCFSISFKPRRPQSLKPFIECLLRASILIPTHFLHNTLIFPVTKPNGFYGLVQDLRCINATVLPIYPAVSDPYMLLSQIPYTTSFYSVLDIKNAFFTIPLNTPTTLCLYLV